MKTNKRDFVLLGLGAAVLTLGLATANLPGIAADSKSKAPAKPAPKIEIDPKLKKKIVPILTFGTSLNVGAAQVTGAEKDVNKCKAVAQLETDYKDKARIKILVPIQTEKIVQHIDRVPGVSVSALADYAIGK
jgi:hypothetical protein